MPSATTTIFATECTPPTRHGSALNNGGRRSAAPRVANDDHMSEEEREGLSDFRRHAPIGLREALGQQYSEFMPSATSRILRKRRSPNTLTFRSHRQPERPMSGNSLVYPVSRGRAGRPEPGGERVNEPTLRSVTHPGNMSIGPDQHG